MKLRVKYYVIVFVLMPLLMLSYDVFAEKMDTESQKELESNSNYTLEVDKDLISLSARDASLKEILEDIGKRMKIDVVTEISDEERVSVKFSKIPIHEAIKRMSANYVYLTDSEGEKGKISKIVVLPKGKGKGKALKSNSSSLKSGEHAKKEKSAPEPFKFQFDPSKYLKEKK